MLLMVANFCSSSQTGHVQTSVCEARLLIQASQHVCPHFRIRGSIWPRISLTLYACAHDGHFKLSVGDMAGYILLFKTLTRVYAQQKALPQKLHQLCASNAAVTFVYHQQTPFDFHKASQTLATNE